LVAVYNGTAWVTTTPVSATVLTGETTTSATYTDLTTVGPSVTVQTGAQAFVMIGGRMDDSGGTAQVFIAPAVSGATTIAATDTFACAVSGQAGTQHQAVFAALVTGLTPGINTFTSKYRTAGGTATFSNRTLTVIGVP
jgi:hypothetical protein